VEYDEGRITSNRQRQNTSVRQLNCGWGALCSFKSIDTQRSGNKAYILTMQCDTHTGHILTDDPFMFPAHLKASEEYKEALRQAKKHREAVLPFSDSQRLIDAENFGVVLLSRDYYNSVSDA
jgi:hypothetical protein